MNSTVFRGCECIKKGVEKALAQIDACAKGSFFVCFGYPLWHRLNHIIHILCVEQEATVLAQLKMRKHVHPSNEHKTLGQLIKRDKYLLLMFLPIFIYYIVFCYLPMAGLTMAFQNFKMGSGFVGVFTGEWVGLKWFEYFFKFPAWTRYLSNTLILSFMNLIFYFPAPILLALMINEIRKRARDRRRLQSELESTIGRLERATASAEAQIDAMLESIGKEKEVDTQSTEVEIEENKPGEAKPEEGAQPGAQS